jgi:hypothetical protein
MIARAGLEGREVPSLKPSQPKFPRVTKENSLVQQFTVDRHTGFYRPAQ